PVSASAGPEALAVTIKQLSYYLRNPALESLKLHLGLRDEDDEEPAPDDEPFVSSSVCANRLTRQVLESFVLNATASSVDQALAQWPERFRELYEEERLRCRVPEQGFGAADQAYLRSELHGRITESLAAFLRGQDKN